MSVGFQPFQAHLASTTDPDKKQMLEKLDAAVTAALQPLQAAMERKDEAVQPLAEVRQDSRPLMFNCSSTFKYEFTFLGKMIQAQNISSDYVNLFYETNSLKRKKKRQINNL